MSGERIEVHPLFKQYCEELKKEALNRGKKISVIEITAHLRDVLKGMPIKEAFGNGNGKKKRELEYEFPHM